MRALNLWAGVIGCLYGTLLSEAGISVFIYARGKRLEVLRKKWTLLFEKKKRLHKFGFDFKSQIIRIIFILMSDGAFLSLES